MAGVETGWALRSLPWPVVPRVCGLITYTSISITQETGQTEGFGIFSGKWPRAPTLTVTQPGAGSTSRHTAQLLAASTNILSHSRSIWRPTCLCKMLSISSVTNLKGFLLLAVILKCQNKSSVLSSTTDGYLGKMTPGEGLLFWAHSKFISGWLQKLAVLWLGLSGGICFQE